MKLPAHFCTGFARQSVMPVLVLIITTSCSIVDIFVITDKQTVSEIKSVLRLHLYKFPFSNAGVQNSWPPGRQSKSVLRLHLYKFPFSNAGVDNSWPPGRQPM
jgi:hypothetical protein